jgi:hypothetical protein
MHFLSRGNPIHGGVVDVASPRCWAPLLAPILVHTNSCNTRCIVLLGHATVFGEVADFPVIVAPVTDRCKLLWWPDCHLLLLLSWRSTVVLLLLLWAVAPELWWRAVRLSRRWGINHTVLQGSTARTAYEGS